jgi:hypothetical protein
MTSSFTLQVGFQARALASHPIHISESKQKHSSRVVDSHNRQTAGAKDKTYVFDNSKTKMRSLATTLLAAFARILLQSNGAVEDDLCEK